MEQELIPIEKAETDCIKDILLLTISMLLTKYTQGTDIFYTVTKTYQKNKAFWKNIQCVPFYLSLQIYYNRNKIDKEINACNKKLESVKCILYYLSCLKALWIFGEYYDHQA